MVMASWNSISISSFNFTKATAANTNGRLCSTLSYSTRKHLPISANSIKLERKKGKNWHKRAYVSLFGVGAAEALAIGFGVLSFFVFAPKPVAQVALNLGKTLKPTIKGLQDVSREAKSTIEREVGPDHISTPSIVNTNGAAPPKEAYTTEEYLKIPEEQLKAESEAHSRPSGL